MLRSPLLLILAALVAGCSDAPPEPAPSAETPRSLDTSLVIDRPNAAFPTVAADGDGRVLVAWAEDDAAFVARLEDGAMSEPVRVSPASDAVAAHGQAPPQVATGPGDEVYVVYVAQTPVEGRRFPASDLRLARSTDGGRTFAPAVTVNDDAGFPTGHHFHAAAVGPDGTVYVSWLDSRESDRPDAATLHDDGPPVRYAHAVHEPTSLTQVRAARSTDGGRSFEPSAVVAEHTCQCCRTALAVGPGGEVYVAWRHIFGENTRDIAVARSTDGGRTFGAPTRVHPDGWQIDGCPHAGPALAVDAGGRLHVVWYTGAEEHRGVLYAASEDEGRTFGAPHPLASGGPIAQVSAAADGERAWIAWEDPVEGAVRVAHVGSDGEAPGPQAVFAERSAPSLILSEGRWALAGQKEGGLVVEAAPVTR